MTVTATQRRVRGPERRSGARDRRRGRPDPRPVFVERRSGRPERRMGGDRRSRERPVRGPALDPDLVFWTANLACWTLVTVVALVWGA
jgi:hypothetical protein